MTEVRVERLPAGDGQEDRAEHGERELRVGDEELHRVVRAHGEEHGRLADDAGHAEPGDR